nr:hypothetical protein [Microbacterium hydrocarbonoxydans]
MSDTYGTTSPSGSDAHHTQDSGRAEAAKHEAADLADTAGSQVKEVIGTAKTEAASVVGEAKTQAKDLYAQTTRELKDQAHAQQQRLAGGLRSVGDDLSSMAERSDGSSVASDLVQQVAGRLSGAANWLGDRDPGSVLTEVKRFARRKPGTFILGAAIVGVAVGRLTRALASNASADDTPTTAPPVSPPREVHPDSAVPVPVGSPASVTGESVTGESGAVSGADLTGAPTRTETDGLTPPTRRGGAQTAWTGAGALGEGDDERPHSL